ncbi:MAG TPA: tetratricopeptide repeat protein [Candidatus Dormibacteraeota bacterium]|nr:tetratricopeptide repeat protein [Candidatus Dormibacteraeota bacterium]
MNEESATRSRIRLAIGVVLLLSLVFLAYLPILPGSFIMDDQKLIHGDNPISTGKLSAASVWFQQDFPLSTVGFWLQRLAWADNPAGYHVINLLLHALSAFLLWRLLAELRIPGAWLAAALFAVHPVCVNSVARIAELKNTLSLPFFLLSLWAYLRYDYTRLHPQAHLSKQPTNSPPLQIGWVKGGPALRSAFGGGGGEGPTSHAPTLWYLLSFLAFIFALFAKSSVVMLPVCLLLCVAWQRRTLAARDLLHISPHFVVAFAFGLMSIWFQKNQALLAPLETQTLWTRLATAGHVFWFYLGKALLPLNLNLVYPRWHITQSLLSLLPLLLAGLALGTAWTFRRTWGRPLLLGIGCFAIALFPAYGLFDAQFMANWQVSDHLQYLPLTAIAALGGAFIYRVPSVLVRRIAGIGIVSAFVFLTFQRAGVFSSEERLLRDSIGKNPAAWSAQNDLGCILAQRQQIPEAIAHFEESLRAKPDFAEAHANLGQALAMGRQFEAAEQHFQTALLVQPNHVEAHKRFARILASHGRHHEAIRHFHAALACKPESQTSLETASLFYQLKEFGRSASHLRTAVKLDPARPQAWNNLAWLLATSSDAKLRNGLEAIHCAQQACRLTEFRDGPMLATLAAAYAEAGLFPQAITVAQKARTRQMAAGQSSMAAMNDQLLALYRAGKAYHEPTQFQGAAAM